MEAINKVSFAGKFWFQIQPHLVSFGWEGMPKDVHCTLAFNDNSPFLNVHLTKNVTGLNETQRKPSIRIVEMSKEELNIISQGLVKRMFGMIIEPYDIVAFKRRCRSKAAFLPFSNFEKPKTAQVIERKLTEALKPISKRQGKGRWKVVNGLEIQLAGFATDRSFLKLMMRELRPLRAKPKSWIEAGILVSKRDSVTVIRILDKWYKVREPKDLKGVLVHLAGERIADTLTKSAKYALAKIRHACVYDDVKQYDKPVRLILKKKATVFI